MVHFVIDAVETLDIRGFFINEEGSGSPQYPPSMMLALLVYSYATGRFSSREIEQATYYDVAVRYLCGGDKHPDHDTICDFRARNRDAFKEAFVKVLLLAQEMGHLKKVGGIAVDGTKIMANASKHAAVSYKRSEEMVKQLELEIEQLTRKALKNAMRTSTRKSRKSMRKRRRPAMTSAPGARNHGVVSPSRLPGILRTADSGNPGTLGLMVVLYCLCLVYK